MKYFAFLSMSVCLCLLAVLSCTPKVTAPIVKQETAPSTPAIEKEGQSKCPNWSEAQNPEGVKTAHVLYRDFLKQNQLDEALPYWEKAYQAAPAADGFRDYHFLDGVKFQEHLMKKESDPSKLAALQDRVFELYDEAAKCYPKKVSLYKGLKAFKLYYTYPERATEKEKYDLFKEVIDKDGKKTADFVINPFTALLLDNIANNRISIEEGRKYAQLVNQAIEYGTKNCKNTKECDRWALVSGYAPARLEELEGVENFYPCAYYKEKYSKEYEANPADCETIGLVYGRLKWGKCPDTDAMLIKLKPEIDRCFPPEVVTPNTPAGPSCNSLLREGSYSQAIDCYEGRAEGNSDAEKTAEYYLTIAKIYYAHLKKFSSARKYARIALEKKPGWGKAHILIGKLYASSGPLCGPGRGFDSQVVTWVAIDEWIKAKRDSETTAEAKTLIAKYQQYMPSREDIFQRSIKEGDSFTVKCWINQSTKVRTP